MAFYSGYMCDKCLIAYEGVGFSAIEVLSISNLLRNARNHGWSVGKQVLCPKCRNSRKRETKESEK